MNAVKHTPGPWEIGFGKHGVTGYGATCHDWDAEKKTTVVYSTRAGCIESKPVILVSAAYCALSPECNTVIAHVFPMPDTTNDTPEVGQANAALIAAAPEMLDALELAARWLANSLPAVDLDEPRPLPVVLTAISKARGTK